MCNKAGFTTLECLLSLIIIAIVGCSLMGLIKANSKIINYNGSKQDIILTGKQIENYLIKSSDVNILNKQELEATISEDKFIVKIYSDKIYATPGTVKFYQKHNNYYFIQEDKLIYLTDSQLKVLIYVLN